MNSHILTSTLMAMLCLGSGTAWSQVCHDIRHFDLRNATIQIQGHDENELQTVFNGPHVGPFTFAMQNGAAFDDNETKEFQAELVSNQLIHPDPRTWIRVIVLDNDHLKGTSTWHYIMALTCKDQRLVKLFQFSSEGVELANLSDQTIRLSQAIWAQNDVHTTPSQHRELLFTWDTKRHQYRRTYASPIQKNN